MVKQPNVRMVIPNKWIKIWKEAKIKKNGREIFAAHKHREGENTDKSPK